MDDQKFDDIVKGKVGEYIDPNYDEGAIGGLHGLLAANYVAPWYAPYKNAGLMAATLGIFTLINWMILRGDEVDPQAISLNQSTTDYSEYKALADELRNEINRLQAFTPDTIYVVNAQAATSVTNPSHETLNENQIIQNFLRRLKNDGQITELGDYFFFHKDETPGLSNFGLMASREATLKSSPLILSYPDIDTLYQEGGIQTIDENRGRLPIKVIRDMEKHYSKGIGLKIGIEGEYARTYPIGASGEGLPGIGFLAELVLSPSFGIETGLKYKTRSYTLENPNANELKNYDGLNNALGEVEAIEVDDRILEIPIHIKYYQPISQNKDLYYTLGISPNIYLSQNFEYSYKLVADDLPQDLVLSDILKENDPKFFIGTVNAGAGLSFDLTNGRSIQLGGFYQRSMGNIGREGRTLNIFGLKSSYWLRVR